MNEPKLHYRVPPCPAYDIPAMEGWLEDMAARGLHLIPDGFFLGLAHFEEGPPKKLRFRLEATVTNGGLLSEEYDPDGDALQMLRDMGWSYRGRRGQFHIYSSGDPDAPELNTDPQVQAVTMAALTGFLRKKLLNGLVLTLFYLFLYFGDALLSVTLLLGTPLVMVFIGLMLWSLVRLIRELAVIAGYRRLLRRGQPLPHRSDDSGRRFLIGRLLRAALWVAVVLCTVGRLVPMLAEEPYEPLTDQTFPFYTLADYYPDARVERQDSFLECQVYGWSDLLAPENYDFSEFARITREGETLDCWLQVRYHRTRWNWTARRLGEEFISQAGANLPEQTAARLFGDEPVTAVRLDLPGADLCVILDEDHTAPTVVVCKGCVVMQVTLDILRDTDPEPETLAALVLSQIR